MNEFESKKFRLMALDDKETDSIYRLFECIAKVGPLVSDLLEDIPLIEEPPETITRYQGLVYQLEGENKRLRAENDRLHNQIHITWQGR